MSFSPVEASKNISEKYSRYLNTIFSIDNEIYNSQLKHQLSSMQYLSAGPYLDVTDSFEIGKSINELIDEGVLANGFRKINMPIDRPLYKHQEIAIRKVISGNNLIVSTGTGSGKTESFLIPVLNHIISEYESGKLDKGVRALLIYPMNALANDQVERLRGVLSEFPEITYGVYTGQTRNKYNDAIADYMQLNDNATPAVNELISREQIKENPPHILITNYAMLEYLMVRPGDSIFFNSENSNKWKYIVLDEAHVYNGSSGIEVSMLLRRLKAKLQNDSIQYILTSATLGSEETNDDVVSFGENLCDSAFSVNDIVRAYRIKPSVEKEVYRISTDFYENLAAQFDSNLDDSSIIEYISNQKYFNSSLSVEENLFDIVLHDANYHDIKRLVEDTKTIQEIAKKMNWSVNQLSSFVKVACKAEKNSSRLFDARYHMFLRATESVFITLNPSNKLFLTRKKTHIENDGTEYAVFEMATCSACHSIYLIGSINGDHLVQSSFNNADDLRSVFLLKNEISDTDDDHSMEEENITAEAYEVCPRCGFIRRSGLAKKVCCEHGSEGLVKLYKVLSKNDSGTITKCLSCENTNTSGIVRMFFTGQEAVTSVIGTALFEELPSYHSVQHKIVEDDEFGFGTSNSDSQYDQVTEAKQFIAFSDNRQAAAFYASYLDQTYHRILYKRLIVETLNSCGVKEIGESIPEFVNDLSAEFDKYNLGRYGWNTIRESWKAILQEMADNNGVTSLFNMGLIGFSFDPAGISANTKLGLSSFEVCNLCNVMALGMMADSAIYYNYSLNKNDKEFYAHKGIEYSYTLSDPNSNGYKRSFIPRHIDRSNKRSDYFRRVMEKIGKKFDQETCNKALESIWNQLFINLGLVKAVEGAYKINSEKVFVTKPSKWFICNKCKKITPYNVHNVCPSYRCEGELNDVNTSELFFDNHYYNIYQDLEIRNLRVVEHTAQLSKEKAYEYQKDFKKKEVDVLSCSTTFEMGVDVGSLETVFMRNMPPSPANYAQRAGRAGRSKDSAAYALTFCNKSNHDFAFFSNPKQMIKGKIDPPNFIVDNEKIAIRHIYASALAFFWSKYPDFFSKASNMMEMDGENERGVDAFRKYLSCHPEDLKDYLIRFLPKSLISKFEINTYGWLDSLIGDETDSLGVLSKALADYEYEVGTLIHAKEETLRKNGYVDNLTQRIKVYQNEDILSFLSRKNVMPKYGFPVDTVELSIHGKAEESKLGLQLQRDLAFAISEYAPGSQVVANGNLLTSRYIKKVPRMSWKMYDYNNCDCRTLNIAPHVGDGPNAQLCTCHQCNSNLDPSKKKVFLIPEFGFEADGDKIEKPGLKKPERTYRGEVSYVGYRSDIDSHVYDISGTAVEVISSKGDEMAVINDSNFFVCETCGYTELNDKQFSKVIKLKHKNTGGFQCSNNVLKRFSLGYRFKTDVLQIRFLYPDITEWTDSLSILFGLIRGISDELSIEQDEIAGCSQYYYNDYTNRANFSLIFYDRTPGGAGHVRRLSDGDVLKRVFEKTLSIMQSCDCGGEKGDSSCYRCLRNYYNQKYHDYLNRGIVVDFLKEVLDEKRNTIDVNLLNREKNDIKTKESIQNTNLFKVDFKNTGLMQNSFSYTEIWDNLFDDCESSEEKEIINKLKEYNLVCKSKPIYGETCILLELNEEVYVDLLWKDKKVMLFLDENYDSYVEAQKTGWKCYCTRNGFDIDSFIRDIEG